jgi:hypothetical protein
MRLFIALTLALALAVPVRAAEAIVSNPDTASLDDARRVTDQLHLSATMARVLDQQKAMLDRTIRQMMPKAHPGASPADVEKAVLRQQKTMDLIWASIDLNDLQGQMARVYSEVFTSDELHGIATFYDTPAGKAAIEKQPQIQQRMMQVMMPKIMAAIQQARMRAALAPSS